MDKKDRCITEDLSDMTTTELMNELPTYFASFGGGPDKNAYLNWRFDLYRDLENQFFEMAKGYFQTSIELIEKCIADNRDRKADLWIFPIMFNIVHGIEIYLKGFNSLYQIHSELSDTGELIRSKIEGKHDIRQLCQVSIKLLKDSKNNEALDEMLFVQKFIDILYENTNDMTFARYPIKADKEAHFYVKSEQNVIIDLNVLRQWVLRLFHVLDLVTGYLDYQIDQLKEWRSEMLREMGNYY